LELRERDLDLERERDEDGDRRPRFCREERDRWREACGDDDRVSLEDSSDDATEERRLRRLCGDRARASSAETRDRLVGFDAVAASDSTLTGGEKAGMEEAGAALVARLCRDAKKALAVFRKSGAASHD